MGRLFQWIRSAAPGRGSLDRPATARRRRPLSFERCEARIALSAADGDLAEDTFAPAIEFQELSDGGSITISFDAGNFLQWSAVKNQFDGIALGRIADYAIRTEPLATLGQGSLNAVSRDATSNWELSFSGNASYLGDNTIVDNAFSTFEPATDGDYGMSLSTPESSGPSINSDLSVIPTPTPSEQPGAGNPNEGGQIALTPFVAPTGLTLSDGYGSSSMARSKTNVEELRETPATRTGDAGRFEGMRGRAVVYEVADATTSELPIDKQSKSAASDRDAIQLASLNTISPDSLERETKAISQLATPTPVEITEAEFNAGVDPQQFESDAEELKFSGELSLNGDEVVGAAVTLNGEAVAHDVAIESSRVTNGLDSKAAALTAPQKDRDRRMLGVGLAIALSYVPLRKALRRRGETVDLHELPHRKQPS